MNKEDEIVSAIKEKHKPNLFLDLRREVATFAQSMELVLRRNDDKGGWDGESIDYLIERLEEEVAELKSVAKVADMLSDVDLKRETRTDILFRVLFECCDVANFAMMISDVLKCPVPDKEIYNR